MFNVDHNGNGIFAGQLSVGGSNLIGWGSSTNITAPSNGSIEFANHAGTSFTQLYFGPGTPVAGTNSAGSTTTILETPGTGNGPSELVTQLGWTLASGTTAQTVGDRIDIMGHNITMSNTTATATTVLVLNVPTAGSSGGVIVHYMVSANDGTNWNTACGQFVVVCSNKAGTVTASASAALVGEVSNANSGTLSAGAVSTSVASQAVSIKIAPTFATIVPTTVTTTITIDVFGQGVTCTPQ